MTKPVDLMVLDGLLRRWIGAAGLMVSVVHVAAETLGLALKQSFLPTCWKTPYKRARN